MREESERPTLQREGKGAPAPQKEGAAAPSPSQVSRRRLRVIQYLTVLFAAAFVLLLYTFLMERRQHELLQQQTEEQIDTLQQSVSAVQSLQNLYDENAALLERANGLEEQLEELQERYDQLEKERGLLEQEGLRQAQTIEAMERLRQIETAFGRREYDLCLSLAEELDTLGLTELLPREAAAGSELLSPYHRLLEIRERLSGA